VMFTLLPACTVHDRALDRAGWSQVALQDHHSRSLDMSGTLNPCLPRHFARVRMTLAQREGLVPAPERSLTQQEWDAVHALAVRRSHCLDGGCAICLEEFGVRQQARMCWCACVCSCICMWGHLCAFVKHSCEEQQRHRAVIVANLLLPKVYYWFDAGIPASCGLSDGFASPWCRAHGRCICSPARACANPCHARCC
jgi:hypothetical protein